MLPAHRYYYLHNFQRALAWIGERNGDLLDETERHFLGRFGQLPLFSQALMVRLLMRRGPWFRSCKLSYEEISDPSLSRSFPRGLFEDACSGDV